MDNIRLLFEQTIKELYSAERHYAKMASRFLRVAKHPRLRSILESYKQQCKGRLDRLDLVAEVELFDPTGKVCEEAVRLSSDAEGVLRTHAPGYTLDVAINACLLRATRYQIHSYEAALAWAELLDTKSAARLLRQIVSEVWHSDEMLDIFSSDESGASSKATSEHGKLAETCQSPR